jgi:dihydropteroate synthase
MGVLNVTPDSFSDGGRYWRAADAVARGTELADQGADIVDVGGESSRPGAGPVDEAEELRRVIPVVEALAGRVRLSVDTTKPAVARAAVAAGATLLNDISGRLYPVAAELGVGWVAMHMQGTPADMQHRPHYADVVGEVTTTLADLATRAHQAGVAEVWLDPGIGFGKTTAHNLALLAHLDRLVATARALGDRVLVGTSRKRFLGLVAEPGRDEPTDVDDRLEASLASAVWGLWHGVGMVRVHDVAETVRAAALVGPGAVGAGRAPAEVAS